MGPARHQRSEGRSPAPARLAYSIDEAAALVGVSSSTLRSWISRGLVVTRINGRVLVRPDRLREHLMRHETSTDLLEQDLQLARAAIERTKP